MPIMSAETINNDFTFAVHAVVMPTLSLVEMSRRVMRHQMPSQQSDHPAQKRI